MRIINTYRDDLLNGDGLRYVIFTTYCTLHCPGCFNSETWKQDCPGSHEWGQTDQENLNNEMKKSWISGVTWSGGNPGEAINLKEIIKINKNLKRDHPEKTIWLYTGFTWETLINEPLWKEALVDIDVLVDGPYIKSLKSPKKPWVGSENQRVIDVQESLRSGTVVLH